MSEEKASISARFVSRYMTGEQKSACSIIAQQCSILETVIDSIPMDGRYKALALTELEKVAMFATKGVSRAPEKYVELDGQEG
jgi:hypothetical protein